MKKIFLFYLLPGFLALSFGSCKKESTKDNNGDYYLKIKINGNWETWPNAICDLGADLYDNTKTDFTVSAASPDLKQTFGYSFQVDGASIPAGTYHSDDYYMPLDYTVGTGGSTIFYSDQYNQEPYSDYSITLISINETTIKGNFAGNTLAHDMDGDNTIAITEGEFVAKRVR